VPRSASAATNDNPIFGDAPAPGSDSKAALPL